MKRNNILKMMATVLAAAGLVSCDDVKETDRYIDMGEITAERAVLLEDFTGQLCLNCPAAHEVIEQLTAQWGEEKLIAVSIHCGSFGISSQYSNFDINYVGLMTEEGNSILQSYPISSFPMGVINMDGTPLTHDLWATAVRDALQQPTDIDLDLKAEYVPAENDGEDGYFGNINVEATVMSGSDRQAFIQFWVVENGIVALQKNGAQLIPNYVHNNVFRAQIFSGHKGEAISLAKGFDKTVNGTIPSHWTDKERWEIDNLYIVGFVSDAQGVLQVKKVKVTDTLAEE